MYNGYYCKQCKNIPIIKANLDVKKLKFNIKCKCNIDYLTFNQMNKKYYSGNIELKNIINNEKTNENINKDKNNIINRMNEIIDKIKINNNSIPIIKNMFIKFLNSQIKIINNLFELLNNINKDYEKFALILIKSYECLNSNYSINKNIDINLYEKLKTINIDDSKTMLDKKGFNAISIFTKKIYELIPIDLNFEQVKYMNKGGYTDYKILKISNKYLLSGINNHKYQYLYIISMNNLENIVKINSPSLIYIDLDKQKNILCLHSKNIKILPKINNNQIEQFQKEYNNNNYYINIEDIPIMEINPIITINLNENIKYSVIISLDNENDTFNESKFIVYDNNYIDFFIYDINKKYYQKYYSFNLKFEIYKVVFIKNSNNILLIFSGSDLSLFDLSSLKIFKNFKIEFYNRISVTQINNKELLFNAKEIINILNLKTYNIHFRFKFNDYITHSFLLNDKSFVICGYKNAKRYSPKTFEIINNFYFSEDLADELTIGEDFNYIIDSLQISDNEIILVLYYKHYKLYKLLI